MQIRVDSEHLNGVVVLQPEVFEDSRGFFMEAFRADQFRELGLPDRFVQDNISGSAKHVVRGLHFQWDPPMGKLMRVGVGSAYLVAVDIRPGSPTLGEHFATVVSAADRRLVWAPAGFARGFCVLSEYAQIHYKCTGIYNGSCESGIRWNDPALAIPWPTATPLLSERDQSAQTLAEWLENPAAPGLNGGGCPCA